MSMIQITLNIVILFFCIDSELQEMEGFLPWSSTPIYRISVPRASRAHTDILHLPLENINNTQLSSCCLLILYLQPTCSLCYPSSCWVLYAQLYVLCVHNCFNTIKIQFIHDSSGKHGAREIQIILRSIHSGAVVHWALRRKWCSEGSEASPEGTIVS